ncbi:MAG: hypothetical protein QM728_04360 [Gordonia sp. (in: high G+C Gram-positive bacteria)]|uniref:hypothetical protein n=1 Tax=Gordonia sp. (in: high G+C Gram-positive bacteria) TaxID=84139 RepID=UPI0039E6304D
MAGWVRATAAVTLSLVVVAFGGGNESAAAVSHHVAHRAQVKKVEPKFEEYQERIDRIAQSPRSMLRPLAENKGKATVCVSGEFTTLRVVYDSLWESIFPILPRELHAQAHGAKAAAHRDMAKIHVSTLAVSNNPMARGADRNIKSGARYRTGASAWIVESLLKIRDGKQNEAIALENITLQQAVETAYLYIFYTTIVPARVALAFLPYSGSVVGPTFLPNGSPSAGMIFPVLPSGPGTDQFLGFLTSYITGLTSYNALLNLAFSGGQIASQYLYQAISNSFINQCVARVTAEQRDAAGKPSDTVEYDIPIPQIIKDTADQLALADYETCHPISHQTLARIVTRTADYAELQFADRAGKQRVRSVERDILRAMRQARVPLHLIPADPADFTQGEQIASLFAGMAVPFIGGAPFDVIIGLNHNRQEGANFAETVSVADLTVTKTLTAAYYAYYVSLWMFGFVGSQVEGPILAMLGFPTPPTLGAVSFTRMIAVTANIPLVHGLVNFHNVVRSMCLREDDTTGTGRGAEYRKDNAVLPEPLTPAELRQQQQRLRATQRRTGRARPRSRTAHPKAGAHRSPHRGRTVAPRRPKGLR